MKRLLQKAAIAAAVLAAFGIAASAQAQPAQAKDVGAYSHLMSRDTGWPY